MIKANIDWADPSERNKFFADQYKEELDRLTSASSPETVIAGMNKLRVIKAMAANIGFEFNLEVSAISLEPPQ